MWHVYERRDGCARSAFFVFLWVCACVHLCVCEWHGRVLVGLQRAYARVLCGRGWRDACACRSQERCSSYRHLCRSMGASAGALTRRLNSLGRCIGRSGLRRDPSRCAAGGDAAACGGARTGCVRAVAECEDGQVLSGRSGEWGARQVGRGCRVPSEGAPALAGVRAAGNAACRSRRPGLRCVNVALACCGEVYRIAGAGMSSSARAARVARRRVRCGTR